MSLKKNGLLFEFINYNDPLSALINEKANELFQSVRKLDVLQTDIDTSGKAYFLSHHVGQRLFFSTQSSAHIIYHAVKMTGMDITRISFTDYGAGLGTLFLLAGKLGFKNVFYNDLFPSWTSNAKILCNGLDIKITGFITGDIDVLLNYGKTNNIHFDILASRNVIEHIYNLKSFYTKLYNSKLVTVCYATTTANYHNLAMRLKHYRFHYKIENIQFKKQREEEIRKQIPGISDKDCKQLVTLTRGRAFEDFTNTINAFMNKEPISPVPNLRTNTCNCVTGVWAENMISRNDYKSIIENAGYTMEFTAGFWDTHYKYRALNWFTGLLNKKIKWIGNKGYWISPFVNVVAHTNKHE